MGTYAQNSIQLINVVGNNTSIVAPNSIIQLTVNAFANKKIDIDIKNIGSTTHSYTVTRYDVLLNRVTSTDTAAAYYCFAGSCYGPAMITSPYLVLRAGARASDTTVADPNAAYYMLTADLDEAGTKGKSIIKYTFKNISSVADSVQFTLSYNNAITGLNHIEKEISSFDVYPNPASDGVEIKLTSNKIGNSKATIVNALGATVLEKDVYVNEGKNNIHFDVSDLPAGVYFARIGNSNGYSTRKFVVN